MKQWLQKKWAGSAWEQKLLIGFGVIALIPSLLSFWPTESKISPNDGRQESLDTHIPSGFVLVPIEVQNPEALDSVLGRYATVDLFLGAVEGKPGRLLARNIRLIRAPHNPHHFAVLVPDARAPDIVANEGTYRVVLKRPTQDGTEFVNSPRKSKRKIVYGGG